MQRFSLYVCTGGYWIGTEERRPCSRLPKGRRVGVAALVTGAHLTATSPTPTLPPKQDRRAALSKLPG